LSCRIDQSRAFAKGNKKVALREHNTQFCRGFEIA
jgi:hypothetical protein